MSAEQPFDVRVGMEEAHTPETLSGCHWDLEEGERFESSDLRFEQCFFLAILRADTFVPSFM